MSTGQVIHLESVDSTNEYLKRQGALLPDGTVVVADHQTAGKGRLGRSWQDAPGQSLLASWLLKSLQGDALLLLPLAAGMAVLDALDSLGAQGAALKWPNDIVAQRDGRCRKLAGILCEHRVGQQSFAVCGIGVNLLQPQEVFDGRRLPDAGSVLGVLGASLKREELLRAIGQSLQKRCAQAAAEPQALLQDVSARCITLGRTVKIKTEAGEYTAFAARLDRDGQLICQSEEGEEIKVRAGEVSVRGLDGYL